MDVAEWLQGLGLERYAPAFRDNEIDWDALPKVSAEDLKDLGVVLGGNRIEQPAAMTSEHHAEIFEILRRQLRQRVPIDFVVAECRHITLEAQTL